jgi:acyl-CoA synthetase (AMP-forming)/AMP-acid ligase II
MNLRDFIESQVAKNPRKTFLDFEDLSLTCEQFDQKVNQAANAFIEWGVRKGDRVGLFLPNRPEFLYGWMGLMKIGAVMVPVHTEFKEKEAGYILNHCEAVGVLTDGEHLEIVKAVKRKSPTLKWIAAVHCGDEPGVFSVDRL